MLLIQRASINSRSWPKLCLRNQGVGALGAPGALPAEAGLGTETVAASVPACFISRVLVHIQITIRGPNILPPAMNGTSRTIIHP